MNSLEHCMRVIHLGPCGTPRPQGKLVLSDAASQRMSTNVSRSVSTAGSRREGHLSYAAAWPDPAPKGVLAGALRGRSLPCG